MTIAEDVREACAQLLDLRKKSRNEDASDAIEKGETLRATISNKVADELEFLARDMRDNLDLSQIEPKEDVQTCLTACRRMGLHEPADLIESLSAQLAACETKWNYTADALVKCTDQCKREIERAEQVEQDGRRLDYIEQNVSMIRDIGWIPQTTVRYEGTTRVQKWSLRKAIDEAMKGGSNEGS